MENTFFYINETSKFFPKLSTKAENVPVGDSITMCIAVSWAPKERGNNYDIMKPVKGFPQCKGTQSGKFIWNSDDPIYGIDVPMWFQKAVDVDCSEESDCIAQCKAMNAIFVNGIKSKRCYSYSILDNICIVIGYDKTTEEYTYAGGCFKDNMHYLLTNAESDRIYYFSGIEIEVRNKKDPVIVAGKMSNYTYSFGQSWVRLNI